MDSLDLMKILWEPLSKIIPKPGPPLMQFPKHSLPPLVR